MWVYEIFKSVRAVLTDIFYAASKLATVTFKTTDNECNNISDIFRETK